MAVTNQQSLVVDAGVVAVQTAGVVDLIRALGPNRVQTLHTAQPLAAHVLAHFQSPATEASWLDEWPEGGREAARRLLQTFVRCGFLVTDDAGPANTDLVGGSGDPADELDVVVQSIVVMVHQLRSDLKAMGDFDRQDGPGGQPEPVALLHTCHRILKQLTERMEAARGPFLDRQIEALSRDRADSPDGAIQLHLGCGDHRLPGWVNVDVSSASADVRLDVRWGLPFNSDTVAAVYIAHLLEHLDYKDEALTTLAEVHRTLRPGGLVRVVVPDIESFLRAYVDGDDDFFARFAQLWERGPSDTPLASFLHYAGAGGFPWVLDRHKFAYDETTLGALLTEAGFIDVRRCVAGESQISDPAIDYSWATSASWAGSPFSLIMEGRA